MNSDTPTRTPGSCYQCGTQLVLEEPNYGVPYWRCPRDTHQPTVVQVPRAVDYALALTRTQLIDPAGSDNLYLFDITDTGRFDFTGRFLDRLECGWQSARESVQNAQSNTETVDSNTADTTSSPPDANTTISDWATSSE